MKRLIFTLSALLFLASGCLAQKAKVIERSEKKTPEWLYDMPDDGLVVDVEASTLSTAKDKAVEEIAKRIIMAVATNVVHSSSSSARHENVDGSVSESESFGFDTRLAAARLPFIKGISLTEAKATYWEKCRENKSDRIFYRFAVLYPLSPSQLRKMREEFEAIDSEKNATLEQLDANINSVSSAAEIEHAVARLNELTEYFFDDVRRKKAEGLLTSYTRLYKGLTLRASQPKNGKVTVTLLLQDKPFQAAGIPSLKSNCATRLQATPLSDGCGFEITYDDTDCLPDEDNWIEVNLRMRDTRLVQKVYI